MYPAIKEVVAGDDYILSVVFENGECGQLDMKPLLDFGVFRRIRQYESFQRVRGAFDTVEWDCGVDLDPEYVYARCRMSKAT